MPADLVARINLDLLYPPFREQLLGLLAACRARGQDYWVVSGTRTWGAQFQLRQDYLEGRGGRAAPAGDSAHQYGLAVDVAPDTNPRKPGLQPSWEPKLFALLEEEAPKFGLETGARYGDRPHVQWPGYVSTKQLGPLKRAYAAHAHLPYVEILQRVWQHLEHGLPRP